MGASASSIGSSLEGKSIHKNQLDPELLKIIDSEGTFPNDINGRDLLNRCSVKTDVFLTHNWGEKQDNHKKVAEVNRLLKQKGLLTWFDDEKMEGNVKKKMVEGIDNTSCVVVFITKLYIDKVGGDNAEDNCQLEFGYSARRKTGHRMIPVVMESGCRSTASWSGEVGMVLGGMLYVDMCDGVSDAKVSELYDRIMSVVGGVSLQTRFDKCIATLSASSPNASSPLPSDVLQKEQVDKWVSWLVQSAGIAHKTAEKYASVLIDNNIATVERLSKKVDKNRHLLTGELHLDEDDAEDIMKAMGITASATTVAVAAVASSSTAVVSGNSNSMPSHSQALIAVRPAATPVRSNYNWKQIHSWPANVSDYGINVCCHSPSGRLAVGGHKTDIHIYNLNNRQEAPMVFQIAPYSLCFSPDGLSLAVGTGGGVILYNARTGDRMWERRNEGFVQSVSFTPDGSKMIATSALDEYSIIDASSGSVLSTHNHSALQICLSSDGNTLVVANLDKMTVIDNLTKMRLTMDQEIRCVCLSSNGSRVFVGKTSGNIEVFDTKNGASIKSMMQAHRHIVIGFCMNSDDTLFVSCSYDKTIKVWNAVTYELIQTLEGHTDAVRSVCFGPNSSIISGSEDDTVRVWD